MKRVFANLAAEPTAIGALVSTTLPALVALGVVTVDAQTIGVIVVAINGIVAGVVRMFVTPAALPSASAEAPAG